MDETIKTELSEENLTEERLEKVAGGREIVRAYDVLRSDYKNGKERMIGDVLRHKGNGRIFYGVVKGLCPYPYSQVVLVNGRCEYYMISKEQYMQIFGVTL